MQWYASLPAGEAGPGYMGPGHITSGGAGTLRPYTWGAMGVSNIGESPAMFHPVHSGDVYPTVVWTCPPDANGIEIRAVQIEGGQQNNPWNDFGTHTVIRKNGGDPILDVSISTMAGYAVWEPNSLYVPVVPDDEIQFYMTGVGGIQFGLWQITITEANTVPEYNWTMAVRVDGGAAGDPSSEVTPAVGDYFDVPEGTVVNISAGPYYGGDGLDFDHWEIDPVPVTGGIANPSSAQTTVTITDDFTVTAVYTDQVLPPRVWNAADDWVNGLDQTVETNTVKGAEWLYCDGGTAWDTLEMQSDYGELLVWKPAGQWGSSACYAPDLISDLEGTLFGPASAPFGGGALQETDDFGGHGSWCLRWVAPQDMWVEISGSIYQVSLSTRATHWILRKNGAIFTDGYVPANGAGTAVDPYDRGYFVDGSGGTASLLQYVQQGDIIDLSCPGSDVYGFGDSGATFVGAKCIITERDDVPPPALLTMQAVAEGVPGDPNCVSPSIYANPHLYAVDSTAIISATRCVECPGVLVFDRWEGPGVADPGAANTTVLMSENRTITAVFVDGRECGDECHPSSDFDSDDNCKIDMTDLSAFALEWLDCTQPTVECDGF